MRPVKGQKHVDQNIIAKKQYLQQRFLPQNKNQSQVTFRLKLEFQLGF